MSLSDNFGFYAVLTDPILGYDRLTRILVDHGVAFVQLRVKDGPVEEILPVAESMRRITSGTATRFVVNDDPHLAVKVGADGVHVGQGDMPYDEVRRIVGPGMLVGLSTHSPEQTAAACALDPDYIGMGPVYATPTKKNPDPVIGLVGLRDMLARATVPAVAIGGIDLVNLRDVLEAGARNFCMVRQLTRSPEPEKVLREMRRIAQEETGSDLRDAP